MADNQQVNEKVWAIVARANRLLHEAEDTMKELDGLALADAPSWWPRLREGLTSAQVLVVKAGDITDETSDTIDRWLARGMPRE
jgi:hypothetical protein